jgi:hypothetical protein
MLYCRAGLDAALYPKRSADEANDPNGPAEPPGNVSACNSKEKRHG